VCRIEMMKKELGLFSLLIVLCLAVCGVEITKQIHQGLPIALPRFLSAENLMNNANLIGIFGILSIGMGIVIITGGIDLSVGSMCAFGGVVLCIALRDWHWAWPLAALFVVAVPMIMGSAHGFLVTKMRVQ